MPRKHPFKTHFYDLWTQSCVEHLCFLCLTDDYCGSVMCFETFFFFFLFFQVPSILIFDFLHLEDIKLISDNLKNHYTSQVLIMWLPHASFSLSNIRKLYSVGLVQMKLFWIQHF